MLGPHRGSLPRCAHSSYTVPYAQCCAPLPPRPGSMIAEAKARARLPPTNYGTPRCCQGLRPCWPRAQRESGPLATDCARSATPGEASPGSIAPMCALPGSTRWPWPTAQRGVYVASAGGLLVGGRKDSCAVRALLPARHVRARRPQQPGRPAHRGRQVWHAAARPQWTQGLRLPLHVPHKPAAPQRQACGGQTHEGGGTAEPPRSGAPRRAPQAAPDSLAPQLPGAPAAPGRSLCARVRPSTGQDAPDALQAAGRGGAHSQSAPPSQRLAAPAYPYAAERLRLRDFGLHHGRGSTARLRNQRGARRRVRRRLFLPLKPRAGRAAALIGRWRWPVRRELRCAGRHLSRAGLACPGALGGREQHGGRRGRLVRHLLPDLQRRLRPPARPARAA